MLYFIGAICAFFTLLVIFKPDFMWSILAAISYMFMLWYVQTYEPFAVGTFGNTVFISICIAGAAFCLLYTIRDNSKKKKVERERMESENKPTGNTEESSDAYYDRMKGLLNAKNKKG